MTHYNWLSFAKFNKPGEPSGHLGVYILTSDKRLNPHEVHAEIDRLGIEPADTDHVQGAEIDEAEALKYPLDTWMSPEFLRKLNTVERVVLKAPVCDDCIEGMARPH